MKTTLEGGVAEEILSIVKRNRSTVSFDKGKITNAVKKALVASGEFKEGLPEKVAEGVFKKIVGARHLNAMFIPTVEGVQDLVETQLVLERLPATAKAYILYRAERNRLRKSYSTIPKDFKILSQDSKKYFKGNFLGEFVYLRTYARWIESEGRRETWIETVDRYINFMKENLGSKLKDEEYRDLREAILRQEVMPSMRLMQFAGDPARRCNTCAYNCSFIAPSNIIDFAEIMYLSMQGCGVGFSVESQNIERLPQIKKQKGIKLKTHTVEDSKEGWCDALNLGLKSWYDGRDIEFDYSLIRPAGARLKTMGGKASGPEPLRQLMTFAREKILHRQGRRLRSVDVHDIICKIGECVVSGGVRRTAMISLSDLDDAELRDAKKGQFYVTDPHRCVANNSAVYEEKPSNTELVEEWLSLMRSGSGERGIFNRGSLSQTLPKRRLTHFKKIKFIDREGQVRGFVGTNPCGEIILQSKQFCNLSEVIARTEDTKETLIRKAHLASLIGTYQSTLTNFRYISSNWAKHCSDERLLGVSITGQWDCEEVRKPDVLSAMREEAIEANEIYAKRFGIKPSLSVTAIKPSGTVSQTFNCSSGIHPRHSKYYIRRIRISATDSLFKLARDQGIPFYPEVGQSAETASTFVLEFPIEAPGTSVFKDDLSALEQLEYWRNVKINFTEHNPSATISVGENEWIDVVGWLEKNWDIVGGLSFLPRFNHVYKLSPYEAISKERYEEMMAAFPEIDYSKLVLYEHSDETEQKRELACVGGACEVDDFPLTAAMAK